MQTASHTKGPWNVVMHGKAAYVSIYCPAGLPNETGWAEFAVQPYSDPKKAEVNARLIAAAPDLLEAAALGMAYDDLLRSYAGPLTVLAAGDSAEIDAAYDKWVSATAAAIAKAVSP